MRQLLFSTLFPVACSAPYYQIRDPTEKSAHDPKSSGVASHQDFPSLLGGEPRIEVLKNLRQVFCAVDQQIQLFINVDEFAGVGIEQRCLVVLAPLCEIVAFFGQFLNALS